MTKRTTSDKYHKCYCRAKEIGEEIEQLGEELNELYEKMERFEEQGLDVEYLARLRELGI